MPRWCLSPVSDALFALHFVLIYTTEMLSKLTAFLRNPESIVVILLIVLMAVVYRNVFLKGYVAFPSNFLASFYSPWSTQRFEGYPNGVPHKPIGGNDQVRMFYPYRTFVNESLSSRELPLWNPYNFSGSPILANFQSSVFYPLNVIYLLLPQIDAWTVLGIIQPILGCLFMYLYLRLHVQRKLAAFLGAISFGFSGFILAWSQENAVVGHSMLWLPLVLYMLERFIERQTARRYALIVVAIFCCMFAGHHQFSLQALTVTVI
jgi:hypothetical protein